MTTNLALARPHCPWDPHRVRSFERISAELGIRNDRDEAVAEASSGFVTSVRTFTGQGPEPTYVWSERMFAWQAEQDTDWVGQLQDDVQLVPEFWSVAKAALEALPESAEVVTFYTLVPQAAELAAQGCNWATTTDWVTGPGWFVRSRFMREDFWPFRQKRLRTGWYEHIRGRLGNSLNEDTLLGLVAAACGKRVWCPLPALVDHDTSIASAHGNPVGQFSRASMNWRAWSERTKNALSVLKDPEYWRPRNTAGEPKDPAVHLGCAYGFTHHNFLRWVLDDGGSYGGLDWGARADQLRTDVVSIEKASEPQAQRSALLPKPRLPVGLAPVRRVL